MVEIKADEEYLNSHSSKVKVLALVESQYGMYVIYDQAGHLRPYLAPLEFAQREWGLAEPDLKPGLVKSTAKYGSEAVWIMALLDGEQRFIDLDEAYESDDLLKSPRWTYEQLAERGHANFRNVVLP